MEKTKIVVFKLKRKGIQLDYTMTLIVVNRSTFYILHDD